MDQYKELGELGQLTIFDLEEKPKVKREPKLKKEHKPLEGMSERKITSRTNQWGYITPRTEGFSCSR